MKKIPDVLVKEMRREMDASKLSRPEQVQWFKWLRYYLDFCLRYHHSTRDPETEVLYLQKISSKGQSEYQQKQASACITMFREVANRFPARGKELELALELTDCPSTRLARSGFGASAGVGGGSDLNSSVCADHE
jgi:hypothetical protein